MPLDDPLNAENSRRQHPELIAHRGAPRERPENTLASFERALELGAEGIELDVHATADGVPVVHHDALLRGGGRSIATLTLEELRGEAARAGKNVPSLAEVFDLVGDRAVLYLELKGRDIERAVVATIQGAGAPIRSAIHSFDHRATAAARTIDDSIPGGVLLASYLVDTPSALTSARARDLWMWWEMIDADLVSAVHAADGRVIAWTVNSGAAATSLAMLGVDGICTDDLPLIRDALGIRSR